MVTRRALLHGSTAVVLGTVLGCRADPAPTEPSAAPTTAAGSPSASPSASPSRTVTPTPAATATPSVPKNPTPVLDEVVAEGLKVPWGIAFLASGAALVGERGTARVLRVSPSGRTRTLGEVPGVLSASRQGEGGLLGLALAPGDPETLFAYLTTESDNRVVRMSLAGGRLGRPRVVLDGIPAGPNHDGGSLLFDRDGHLLVSTGDAGDSSLAQDRGSLAGKILRIRTNGSAAPGNPFDNRTWSYGHRNVEGLAFDAEGRLWATEFGAQETDELNLIRRGGNYGWPEFEGRSNRDGLTSPAVVWSPTSSCSPAGVAVAGSTAFVGALRGQCLFAVPLDGTRAGTPKAYFEGEHGRLRTVALAPDASLWVTTSNTDGRGQPGPGDDKILRVRLR